MHVLQPRRQRKLRTTVNSCSCHVVQDRNTRDLEHGFSLGCRLWLSEAFFKWVYALGYELSFNMFY